VENALPAMTDREPANPDQSLQQTSERSPSADEIFNLPDRAAKKVRRPGTIGSPKMMFFAELSFTRQRFTAR
jgi:hypothetical protein